MSNNYLNKKSLLFYDIVMLIIFQSSTWIELPTSPTELPMIKLDYFPVDLCGLYILGDWRTIKGISRKTWIGFSSILLCTGTIYKNRPTIDIEDTNRSTCCSSKCVWWQLLSFLLSLWVPPLVAIGPSSLTPRACEAQGLCETMPLWRKWHYFKFY